MPLKTLIIEDDDTDYRLLLMHLQRNGLSLEPTRVVSSKELAVALGRNDWDLVLTDYTLPDIDIRRSLQNILASTREAPVILVSGTIGEELAVEFLKAGVEDFVSKQNLSRLLPAINRALEAAQIRREKHRAEAELLLRDRALAATSNGVVITSAEDDMPIVYVNRAFENISGYPANELLGKNCRMLQGDDRDQADLDVIRAAILAGDNCHTVLRNYRKDGSSFWNALSLSPLHDTQGQITHYIGIQEDVTQRRNREYRLRQSAVVFETAAEGIIISDAQARVLDVNAAFTKILGYSAEDVIGRKPDVWKSNLHDREFYQSMWNTLQSTGRWEGEITNRHQDGHLVNEWLNISCVRDATGTPTRYVGVFTDLSQERRMQQQMEHLLYYDNLTGLPNRILFKVRLQHALEHAHRNQQDLAVLFIDLDRFKIINDSFGRSIGDQCLRIVGARLQACLQTQDTVAYSSADEFLVLLEELDYPTAAGTVAAELNELFKEPISIQQHELYTELTIGIGMYPRDGEDADTLTQNAEAANYRAKQSGRGGYAYYAEELTQHAFAQVLLENALRKALDRDELVVYYQAQTELGSGRLIGMEALLRWQHPTFGLVEPLRFIKLAEDSGLILPIGEWVLQTACSQAQSWLNAGMKFERLAVNVSGKQISSGGLLNTTRQVLDSAGFAADRLELEVTETFIMETAKSSINSLSQLRKLGVSLAIDDFGTGYSSLAYLKRLPVNRLKIDQSFVQDIATDADDQAICEAILALGKSLHLDVLAEGIEHPEQLQFLRNAGCVSGQGYLFSQPLPAQEFGENWLKVIQKNNRPM